MMELNNAPGNSLLAIEIYLHLSIFDTNLVSSDRSYGGRVEDIPGAQIESRPVSPALNGTIGDVAIGQARCFVRTFVANCEYLAPDPYQTHGNLVNHNLARHPVCQLGHWAGMCPAHRPPPISSFPQQPPI
jgi:hypothetical protein